MPASTEYTRTAFTEKAPERKIPRRSDLLRAALEYARKGIPVFPCKPAPDKSPLTDHGFKDATTNPRQITAWWNAHPDAAIGVPTGPRFWVLDVDDFAALAELEAVHGKIPATFRVRTPRGGLHYYFKPADGIGNSRGSLPAGLDVRGIGTGYVLAPPSKGYRAEERAPMDEAPEWLTEAVRRKPEPRSADPGERAFLSDVSSGPIPDGQRDDTLFRIGCKLRGEGHEEGYILDALDRVNRARCAPPLPDEQVRVKARQAARYPKGNAAAKASAETLEALDAVERLIREPEGWKGNAWKSPYSALVVLVKEARRHGTITEAGVEVRISVRRLALEMATSKETARKALNRLYEAGIAARVAGGGSGRQAGRIAMRAKLAHSSTGARPPRSVPTLRAPYSSPRLRWSRPVFESGARVDTIRRLGKTAERTVDLLETRKGWTEVRDLADDLGIGRPRDFRRRTLGRLEASAVVECSGDSVRLRPDWLAALDRRRVEDLEVEDLERDRKKFAEESRRYATKLEARKLWRVGLDVAEIAAELDIGSEDVRRLLDLQRGVLEAVPDPVEADGLISELESEADVVELDEGVDVEILSALADALIRWPDHRHDYPSWWASTLHVEGWLDYRPDPGEVARALAMLPEKRAA